MKAKTLIITLLLLTTAVSAKSQINYKHYVLMGRIDLSEEKYSDAIRNLNIAITAKPTDFEAYFLRGIAKFSLNDFTGAVADFSKTLEIHPLYVRAFHYRGVANDRLGNYADAQADYAMAIGLDPYSVELHLASGATKMHLNDFEGAIADFDTALIINPNNANAYMNRGIAKRYLENLDDALNDMNQAVYNDYFNVEALVRRGMIQLERKDYQQAMNDFNSALKMEPYNSLIYFNRGITFLNLGDTIAALNDYEKVNNLDQRNALTYYNRAIIYSILKEYNIALALYDKVIEINPENIYGYFNRGVLYYKMKKWDEAEADFSSVIKLFPDFIDAWVNRAVVRFEKNDIKGAQQDQYKAKEIMNLISEDERNVDSLYNIYSKSIDYDNIIAFESDFTNGDKGGKLAQFSNIDILPFNNFIITVIDIDKYKKGEIRKNYFLDATLSQINENSGLAEQLAYTTEDLLSTEHQSLLNDSIIKHTTNNELSTFLEGIANFEIYNYQHAEKAFNSLIDNKIFYTYALINISAVQFTKAELVLSNQNYDNSVSITQKKTTETTIQGPKNKPDYSQSLETLEKLLAKDSKNPFLWYNIGNIHLQMQEFNKAIDDYSKAIKYEPNLAEAYYNRALTLLFLGENKLANNDLSKAGELGITESYAVIKRFFNK